MPTNITEPLTPAGSILRIVTTGVQLGTTLQTYMELAREAEHELHDIAFDVNATATALKQLHAIIDTDRDQSDSTVAVFKDDGVREVEMLALKCHTIYNNVTVLIQRAGHSGSAGADSGGGSYSRSVPAADGVALDPMSPRPLTLIAKLQWPWLRPQILRCCQQLNWLKVSLLFTLQIASIAHWQMSGKRHAEAPYDIESRQQTARQLQKRRNSILRNLAENEAEGGTRHELQRPVTASSHAESVLSSIVSTTEQNTREESTALFDSEVDVHTGLDGSRQHSTTSCIPTGTENIPVDMNNKPTKARSHIAKKGLPDMRDVSVLPEFSNMMLSGFLSTAASTFSAKTSNSTPWEPVPECDNLSRHAPTLNPTGNTQSHKLPAIIQLPSNLKHWSDRFFGRQKEYRNDKQSTTLEAYIAENHGRDVPIKVPFGHKRLLSGLEKILKGWHGDQWTKYLAASPSTRLQLDAVAEVARKAGNHEKTCLAFKAYSRQDKAEPFLLVFFSLEKAKEPIILSFNGRRYSLPFASCRTLHDMDERVREVCRSSLQHSSLPNFIAEKRYEFADQNSNIILPSFLIESIHPGIELSLLPQRMSTETPSKDDTRQIGIMTREPLMHGSMSQLARQDGPSQPGGMMLDPQPKPEKYQGCETCRRRRVPCTNERPFCHKCVSSGRECQGYERERVFVTGSLKDHGRAASRLKRVTPPKNQNSKPSEPRHERYRSHSLKLAPNLNTIAWNDNIVQVKTAIRQTGQRAKRYLWLRLRRKSRQSLYDNKPRRPMGTMSIFGNSQHTTVALRTLVSAIKPPEDGSGPGFESGQHTLPKNVDDEDLDLNVLDVDKEIVKGDTSIEKWLIQMTNIPNIVDSISTI